MLKESSVLASDAIDARLVAVYQKRMAAIRPAKPKEHALVRALLKDLPLYTGYISYLNKTGSLITNVTTTVTHVTKEAMIASQIFDQIGLTTTALRFASEFIRVPVIYLAARLTGQSVPLELTDAARLAYASVLFGLTVTALAVPVTAPFIAVAGASLGLASAGVTLLNVYKDRKKTSEQLASVTREVNGLQIDLKGQIQLLQTMYGEYRPDDLQEMDALREVQAEIETKLARLQQLKNHQFFLKEKATKLAEDGVFNKSMALITSCVAVVGVVVSLFIPPLGVGILMGVVGFGVAFSGFEMIKKLLKPKANHALPSDKPMEKTSLRLSQEENPAPESSLQMLAALDKAPKREDPSSTAEAKLMNTARQVIEVGDGDELDPSMSPDLEANPTALDESVPEPSKRI